MPNPILGGGGFHHVCVKTRDWDRTMQFYREVLGCTEKIAWRAPPERAVTLDAGDGPFPANHANVRECNRGGLEH